MPDDAPPRLKQGQNTPDELIRALKALRQGADESARLARVGQRLGNLLDAAPPTTAPPTAELGLGNGASGAATAGTKLGLLKWLVVGLGTVLVPLVFYLQSSLLPARTGAGAPAARLGRQDAQSAAGASEATVEQPTVDSKATRAEVIEPSHAGPMASPDAASNAKPDVITPTPAKHGARAQRETTAHARSETTTRAQRERTARGQREHATTARASADEAQAARGEHEVPQALASDHAVETAEAPAAEAQSVASNAQVSRAGAVVQPRAEPMAQSPRKTSSMRDPQPRRQPLPVPSEAKLLLDARTALKRDATRALQVLREHETLYPSGRLVPEREVLAIEALRSLGRIQEAGERMGRFEARYPHSIHLKRLRETSR